MPTHAYHLPILNHLLSVLQTRYASTSAALPVPVILAPSVAKKPHTRLNGGPRPLPPAFLRGFAALTYLAASPTEKSMTRKSLCRCETWWVLLMLLALASILRPGPPAPAPHVPALAFPRS